jgi:microcystin-dependent protein
MSDYYVGEIRLFAFNQYAPEDFLPCDGRSVRIVDYQVLYSLIGTTYGGDGVSTFNLPDLRTRTPVNYGQMPGGSPYTLGQKAGVELVTLTSAMVPPHSHTVSVTKNAANSMTPASNNAPGNVGGNFYYCNQTQAGIGFQTAAQTITTNGGNNQPHSNIQPSLVLAYAIAARGLYPEFGN